MPRQSKSSRLPFLFLICLILLLCLFPIAIPFARAQSDPHYKPAPAIAIDLGTTYSCVAVQRDNQVQIIPNDKGERITPSWVSFTDAGRLVGQSAKNALHSNPANTVFDAKRLIGRRYDEIKADLKHFPFKVINHLGKPRIEVHHHNELVHFTPEEISAMVLTKMKLTAEAYLGQNVTEAVITVPAYFNDGQRQATKDAGRIAGLNVLRVLNEPTAAAIAYGLNQKTGESQVLVYDLGGGTLDVSLLSIDDGVFEVLATSGDNHLGGEDFDNRLIDYLQELYIQRGGKDVSSDPFFLAKLRAEAESAKRTLSSKLSATIEINLSGPNGDIHFHETITRAKFEEINMDLFKRALVPVEQVLKDTKIRKEDISDVVLVGGSTRIPKISELLTNFIGKAPSQGVDPDEAVAYGAAIQAGILSSLDNHPEVQLLIDICPLTLGIETSGGVFTKIIPKNTVIPTHKTQTFTTTVDNQSSVNIRVYQGEQVLTKDNHYLGQFELSGISPAQRGVPQIEVKFAVDANGILKASAIDKATGNSNAIVVTKGRLTREEIDDILRQAEVFETQDKAVQQRAEVLSSLGQVLTELRSQTADSRLHSNSFSEDDALVVSHIIEDTFKWMNFHRQSASLEDLEEKLADIVAKVNPILYPLPDPTTFLSGETARPGSNQDSQITHHEL